MENFFKQYRENTIGNDLWIETPYGKKKLIYADWVASGRLYHPIEKKLQEEIGPFVANTHTETSETGKMMTFAYHEARNIIKKHVNANSDDVLILSGFGMTGAVNKFQRILGLKGCGKLRNNVCIKEKERPIIFITHMEHHSNQTSWYETICDVVIVDADKDGLPSVENLQKALDQYQDRKLKIGSFTACSNVTGIETNYHALAKTMHKNGGLCFVDFAANAPYSDIDMHPEDPMESLDAIFFSPHKFLGGPGSSGVLIFNNGLYNSNAPDNPGGGTVDWTNAWGEYKYVDDIEAREDGGTPGFLQAIRAALAIQLKEDMGTENIHRREDELVNRVFDRAKNIKGLHLLESHYTKRTGAISFFFENIHHNLVVKLLNDHFGIQMRGGCACAGTYGHILFNINIEESHRITNKINLGDLSEKPGFVRMSIHPTMLDSELEVILDAFEKIAQNHEEWAKDYTYDKKSNEFFHKTYLDKNKDNISHWFNLNK